MNKNTIWTILLLTILIFNTGCEKWNYEKRADHDIVSFEKSVTISNGIEKAWSVISTNDNHYVIVGTSLNTANNSTDVFLHKIDENGKTIWSKSNEIWYYTTQVDYDEQGISVIQTNDNGFVIVGSRNIPGKNLQFYLLKTDDQGNFEWEKNFGGDENDEGYSIIEKDDGGFLLFGYTNSFSILNNEIEPIIYETDDNGNELAYFVGNLGTVYNDYGYCIKRTTDNKYVLFINSYNSEGNSDLYLGKLDNSISQSPALKLILQNSGDVIVSVIQNNESSYAVAAITANSPELKLIITDDSEQAPSIKTYSGTDASGGASVYQTRDNGYILLSSDMTMIKTDDAGTELWRVQFDGNAYGNHCVRQTDDGGYLLIGQTSTSDIHIIKTDPEGNIR